MRIWTEHDKDTAYAPVSRILEAITTEQAGTLAAGLPHSIYQELWHLTTWQHLVISKDEEARQRWEGRQFSPDPTPPVDSDWQELVRIFMTDIEKGERMAEDTSTIDQPYFEGFTARETLEDLAVHNAYHLARIVALRQVLGIWNPA